MATPRKTASTQSGSDEVDDFLRTLEHPRKAEIEAVRRLILAASPTIAEGIKWKSPSFRVAEYFATVNLRAKEGVQLIFHQGAKVTDSATTGIPIEDPAGLLEWLAKDRASVSFKDGKALAAKAEAFQELVRQWIARLP